MSDSVGFDLKIPEGYIPLPEGTIKQEGDLFLTASGWSKVQVIGDPVGLDYPVIRKDKELMSESTVLDPQAPQIPEGYSLLPTGTKVQEGDMFWSETSQEFKPFKLGIGGSISEGIMAIRRETEDPDNPKIPEGYERLKPGTIKEPEDLIWVKTAKRWVNSRSPGNPVRGKQITIRKTKQKEEPQTKEWGTW